MLRTMTMTMTIQPSNFLFLRLTGGLAEALSFELPRSGASRVAVVRSSEGYGQGR